MDLGTSSKGGKKPLDTAINLVPFIDLMAVTISFLIMTAVWTQIGRLQVSQSGGISQEEQQEQENQVPVNLTVTEKELRLSAGPASFDPIPVTRTEKNKIDLTRLAEKIKELKTTLSPEPTAITVTPEDTVRYEDLVRIIDECKGLGLENVSLASMS
jgi:biopolymer transport protein ExbD